MTKTEVQEKIRYNERLVTQYQNEVRDCQRKIDNSTSEINRVNSQISDSTAQKNQVNQKIDELSQLKRKFQTLQTNFNDRQTKRIRALDSMKASYPPVNFIQSYLTGMNELLRGPEYKNPLQGIIQGLEDIEKEKGEWNRRREEVEKSMDKLSKLLKDLMNNRVHYQKQRDTANSNLSYRKGQVTYWKNQLKYATD